MTTVDHKADRTNSAPRTPSKVKRTFIAWTRRILVLVVVAFAGYAIARNWTSVWAELTTLSLHATALSTMFVLTGIFLGAYAWQLTVDDLGHPIGFRLGAQAYLVGQLGKYVPGSAWQYLLQMELGRKVGASRARIFTASFIVLGISIVTMTLLGLLSLPGILQYAPNAAWLFALLPIGLLALHPKVMTWCASLTLRMLRRAPLDHALSYQLIGKVLGLQTASYLCYGMHLWVLAASSGSPGVSELMLFTGAISIGLLGGIFVFIVPSGAGVRDAILVGVLTTLLPPATALAFTLVSRLVFTVMEAVAAGIGALLPKLSHTSLLSQQG